jgi:ankyrin repeat protein
MKGDVKSAQTAIADGARINSRHPSDWDPHGQQPVFGNWTPLHRAAYFNRRDIAELLINSGAKVNAADAFERTPLHWAAMKGSKEVVQLLINHRANLNPKGRDRSASPLWLATTEKHNDVVSLLRRKGATLTQFEQKDLDDYLNGATHGGDAKRVKMLLDQGANINNVSLHEVANNGYASKLKVLLDAGADVNSIGTMGETMLHQASGGGSAETVELLLSHGADINAKDKKGHVAFLWAMYNGQKDVMRILLEKGADVNAQDNKGISLFQHAKNSNRLDAFELLRSHGAQSDR